MFGQAELLWSGWKFIIQLAIEKKEVLILSRDFQNKLTQTRIPSAKVMSYSIMDTCVRTNIVIYGNM